MSACDAITPPAPGRFSMTTDWPHCFETTSPSVRARISTPPPAAYGTKMRTGLDGNGDCADAIPTAANVATVVTANLIHPRTASAPIFFITISLITRQHIQDIAGMCRSQVRPAHVDNP
jgi:hypothetical protein